MYKISEQLGQVVAADTQSSVASLNNAVIAQSRMCATVLEASEAARLPVSTVQKTLEALATGLARLVASRSELSTAVRELSEIQSCSNLRETSFGCPNGPFTSAMAENEPATAETSD